MALGAEQLVSWEQGDIDQIIDELRSDGYQILGLETGEGAKDINSINEDKIALVLGSEVEGIDQETIDKLDGIVEIPMNKKRSLNVSVASGVAMYSVLKK